MTKTSDGTSISQEKSLVIKALICVSIWAWAMSLALRGFTVSSPVETWSGARILGYGLFFGWSVQGWAVYANVFYVVAVVRVSLGRKPLLAVALMTAFAATLPLFQGTPVSIEGGGLKLVQSWGHGLVLWLLALTLIAAATLIQAKKID